MTSSKKQYASAIGKKPGKGEEKVKLKLAGGKNRWVIRKKIITIKSNVAVGFQVSEGKAALVDVQPNEPHEMEETHSPLNDAVEVIKITDVDPPVYIGKAYLERTHREFEIQEADEAFSAETSGA